MTIDKKYGRQFKANKAIEKNQQQQLPWKNIWFWSYQGSWPKTTKKNCKAL